MTAKDGPGQQVKAASERKTAEVAREDAANTGQDGAGDAQAPGTDEQGASLRAGTDDTPERSDGAPARPVGVDAAVDPYPAYEELSVDELRALGEQRKVEINRDVEKSYLIAALRKEDTGATASDRQLRGADAKNPFPSYDSMPLEELRALASSRDVRIDEDTERAHWVTELRAADSGVNTGGGTTI